MLATVSNGVAQYRIQRQVVGTGIVNCSANSHRVIGTVGQPIIGMTTLPQSGTCDQGFWIRISKPTAVEQLGNEIPSQFRLVQLYPNPAASRVSVEFEIQREQVVDLTITDMLGRTVTDSPSEVLTAGRYQSTIEVGSLPDGVYFVRIVSNDQLTMRKFTIRR